MDELNFKDAPDSKQESEQQQEQSTSTDQAKQVQEKIENKLGEEYAGIKGKDLPQTPYGPQEKTLGEQRIRTSFNVSGKSEVDNVKSAFAGLIDLCESHKEKDPRLAAKAQTEIENAAMWTVKLLTA